MKKLTFEAKCRSCSGTGIYSGMGERDGAGVVCYTCKGTGKEIIKVSYEPFKEKIICNKTKWVLPSNPGITIGKGNGFKFADFGGMSYDDWLKDGIFPVKSEMRKFTCPAWWYQGVDYDKKPRWKECAFGGAFSDCTSFENKEACWHRWDEQFGK